MHYFALLLIVVSIMKKLLLLLLVVLIISSLGIYIFIPAKLTITSAVVVKTTDNGTERFMLDEAQWQKWWNYDSTTVNPGYNVSSFTKGKDNYTLSQKFYKSGEIQIVHAGQSLHSKFTLIPLTLDSTGIEWNAVMTAGSDPYSRLTKYFEAREIKKNMDSVLGNLKQFLSKSENVYGINIERDHLKDTLYVAAKSTLATRPSTPVVYELIKKIQAYINSHHQKQTGNPIYNVTEMATGNFQLMAAIPVEKELPEVNGFSMKHMVRGSFMITEVTGGEYAVNKASRSLQQYFQDFRRTSMAMNFTMLITDRMYQPDSTKWITKLYQPVY